MQLVDRVISERLTSDVPLVKEVSQYIISAGGKRLRPALLLLVSGALGSTHPLKSQLFRALRKLQKQLAFYRADLGIS